MGFELVIFDLGGVLVRVERERLLERLAQETRKPLAWLEDIMADAKLLDPFERGHVQPKQFFQQFRERLGIAWTDEQLITAWNGILYENLETTWLLQRLRERYTLLVLTNTNVLHDEYIRQTWSVFRHVHHWIASYQVGWRKPEPEMYQLALRQARVEPRAAIYVDDTKELVDAARQLGLTGIHFRPGLKLAEELHAAGLHV